ncbi:hypothetical protein CEB3_c14310 [Peptococcaceae bacterium CEB3]|nr:hypothetical protein CEB3_c14310 [Peptococcaceae bacterium CEB3]
MRTAHDIDMTRRGHAMLKYAVPGVHQIAMGVIFYPVASAGV